MLHFPVSCYWFMDDLRYYCQITMIIFVLMMTMIIMIMILHKMKSANESLDLVLTSNNKIACQ